MIVAALSSTVSALPRLAGSLWVVLWLLLGWPAASLADRPVTFYVSLSGDDRNPGTEREPFRSLARAQAAVRPLIAGTATDIIVYLRGGTYSLSEPFTFDHRDSGANGYRVIYRSFPGERAVLSGGRILSGWTPLENGLFRAAAGGRRFRQLYVDGARGVRARAPNEPDFSRLRRWDEATRRLVVPHGAVGRWDDLAAVEMVILKQWTQDNLRVESFTVEDEGLFVTPREPDRTKAFMGHLALRFEDQSYLVENALELLDVPGEWYRRASTDEVFYKPRPGEDMTRATVVVPVLERLVEVHGTPRDPVHDIVLTELVFEHSGWVRPSDEGFATIQADVVFLDADDRNGRVGAAVWVEHAHQVRLERNVFRQLGGTALALHTGVSDTQVVGNRFEDLSGSGIVVDGALDPRPIDPRFPCRGNLIANNLIQRIGLDYRSSVGIFGGYVSDLTIEHNEIREAPYTGISLGWGWTDDQTELGNNRIRWNHVSRVMTTMADGAGIYTLSNQPGTVIHGNYVHDLARSPWAGHYPIPAVYLDEGSSGIVVSDNVLERVPLGIFFHRASRNVVVNTQGTHEERNGAAENVVREEPGFDAQAITSRAGLEPAYADLHEAR